jgi:hypothetical protein
MVVSGAKANTEACVLLKRIRATKMKFSLYTLWLKNKFDIPYIFFVVDE